MSRIGKSPITIPSGVTVSITPTDVVVKGLKGELSTPLHEQITVSIKDDQVTLIRKNNEPESRALHGLMRSLISNMVLGVTEGFTKTLKLIGTGYRVTAKGAGLSLKLGYSHDVEFEAVDGVTFKIEGNDTIHINGIDKQKVGQVAANVRSLRPPEPYKGKGVRYIDETVKIKPGKTSVA